ncbi:hypothetical protein ABKN59_007281 [Abortiporus biennis]
MAMFGKIIIMLIKTKTIDDVSFEWVEFAEAIMSAHAKLFIQYKRSGNEIFVTEHLKGCRTLFPIWFSTLQELRACNIKPEETYCLEILRIYTAFGTDVGASEQTLMEWQQQQRVDDLRNGQPVDSTSCHWKECVCHKTKAFHQMRVCKGCRKVFYCGVRCQTK